MLADVLADVDDVFLEYYGFVKGSRREVFRAVLNGLMAKLAPNYAMAPGGSACNTVMGAARLGAPAAFAAKCGHDHLGAMLQNALNDGGVTAHIATAANARTGLCVSLITPDCERTMLVDLAASNALTAQDAPPDFFQNAGIAHFEAYMAQNPNLMLSLLDAAYDAGCTISLDLGSFSIIKPNLDFLRRIIADYVDILMGNYAEGRAYAGCNDEAGILAAMGQNVSLAALKKGPLGSALFTNGQITQIAAVNDPARKVIDTTGAGDLWNSGFLYGLLNGYDLAAAGRLASCCGFEVCCRKGAHLEAQDWERVKANFYV